MTAIQVNLNQTYFPLFNEGRPVSNGYIYIGEPDTDPEIPSNQKTVQLEQEDGTIVTASQPIRTSAGGVPIYDNSPAAILVDGNYSAKVLDKNGSQVYYWPRNNDEGRGNLVTYRDTVTEMKAITGMSDGSVVEVTTTSRTGAFRWTDGDFTTETASDSQEGVYVQSDTIPVTEGVWVRIGVAGDVELGWFGDPFTDAGAVLNSMLDDATDNRWRINLPAGRLPVLTPIYYTGENSSSNDPLVSIRGRGAVNKTNEGSGFDASQLQSGTVLDGGTLTSPVVYLNRNLSNLTTDLRDFAIAGGSSDGLKMNLAIGYVHNVAAYDCGGRGFDIRDNYSPLGDLWAYGCNTGFYFFRCNACRVNEIKARHSTGDWAVEVNEGSCFEIGLAYIESNHGSLLRTWGAAIGFKIGALYSENNNTDENRDYGILIGDSSQSTVGSSSISIDTIKMNQNSAQAFAEGFIGLDRADFLSVSNTRVSSNVPENFIKVVPGSNFNTLSLSNIMIGAGLTSVTLDLSSAPSDSQTSFFGCEITNPSNISLPSSQASVSAYGCIPYLNPKNGIASIFEKTTTSNATLKPWETNVTVDTGSGPVTITLPDGDRSINGEVVISNLNNAGNDVTVTGSQSISGSANNTIPSLSSATYKFNTLNNQWRVISRGTKAP